MTTVDETPKKPRVVNLAGAAFDLGPMTDETKRARTQLQHWAGQADSYVAAIVTADGIVLASSLEDPARVLQLADLVRHMASEWSRDVMLAAYEDDDEDCGV